MVSEVTHNMLEVEKYFSVSLCRPSQIICTGEKVGCAILVCCSLLVASIPRVGFECLWQKCVRQTMSQQLTLSIAGTYYWPDCGLVLICNQCSKKELLVLCDAP